MSIKGLNLGGVDNDLTTPPSGPAEPVSEPTKETAEDSEAPVEGDTADVAAAELDDERADAEQPTDEPADEQKDADGIPDVIIEQSEAPAAEPAARWSSHPIARYAVGDYHFVNGLLVLHTKEEAENFQKVYDSLPVYEQCRMTKIDLSAAEALVRERLAIGGGATKVMDSSVGDRAPHGAVGTGDLLG